MRNLIALALVCLPLTAQFSSFTIAATDPVLQTTQGRVLEFPVPVRGGVAPYRFFIAGDLTVPAGITLDPLTGVLRVAAPNPGYSRLELCAQDVSRAIVCATYLVRVAAVNASAPTVLPTGRVSNFYDRVLEGSSGNQVEFSLASGALPPGIALNTFGRLVGAPLVPGAFGFSLRARDVLEGETQFREYLLTIDGPQLVTNTLPNGFLDTEYSAPLAALGGSAPFTWSLLRGPLPPGFGLTSDGRLTGRSPVAGPYVFLLRVQDSLGSAFDREVRIVIEPSLDPLLITTTALPVGSLGVPYRFALNAVGGRAPFSWRVASGQLPPGLSMASDGVIAGTPSAAVTSTVQVELRDLSGASRVASFLLTILAGVAVTSNPSLPGATAGVAYRAVLTAAGGTSPYRWSLAAGSLPLGLSLSPEGIISGVPAAPIRSEFTVRLTDAANASVTAVVRLNVAAARPTIANGGIVSAASFLGTAIAPGQILTIFGGPFSYAGLDSFVPGPNGQVPTIIGGTRLLFDGVAGPLLYIAPGQLSGIVPYAVAGKVAAEVVVEVNGIRSEPTRINVVAAAPAIFTADSSGKGPAAAILTGDVVTLFLTGEGLLDPRPIDGAPIGEPLPRPILPVRAVVGGRDAEVLYAGGAPGLVAGVMQVNLRVPVGVSGAAIPISIRVGTAESQPGVTLRFEP